MANYDLDNFQSEQLSSGMANYDLDHFNSEQLSFQVLAIHICGYRNLNNKGDEDGAPPTNHWATFLELPKEISVRLDMAPGYGSDGRRGKIELASETYIFSPNAAKTVSYAMKRDTTVQNIKDVIDAKGRDKYTFTEEWEGCRHWVYTLISDLEAEGIIEAGSAVVAWDAVSHYWRYPSGCEQREVKKGTFRS